MEQIKIRGWNTQENKMLFRKLFDMNWYTTEKNDENGSHCWGAISGGQSRFIKPMLWTGLKDKNGKEIYEGDICKYPFADDEANCIGEVDYMGAMFAIGGLGLNQMAKGSVEIIGNIWENPELLSTNN